MKGQIDKKPEKLEIPSRAIVEKRLWGIDEESSEAAKKIEKPAIGSCQQPPNQLLDRLRTFLPTLEAANKDLEHQSTTKESISFADNKKIAEACEDCFEMPENTTAEQYVELDLACGVFELKDKTSVAAAEQSVYQRPNNSETEVKRKEASGNKSSSESCEYDDFGIDKIEGRKRVPSLRPKLRKCSKKRHSGIQELN